MSQGLPEIKFLSYYFCKFDAGARKNVGMSWVISKVRHELKMKRKIRLGGLNVKLVPVLIWAEIIIIKIKYAGNMSFKKNINESWNVASLLEVYGFTHEIDSEFQASGFGRSDLSYFPSETEKRTDLINEKWRQIIV